MNDLDLLVEMFAKAGKPVVESNNPATITYEPIVLENFTLSKSFPVNLTNKLIGVKIIKYINHF